MRLLSSYFAQNLIEPSKKKLFDMLNQPLRRRRVALTSLIDVIFLLLLFFMLSSTFLKFGEIKLDLVGKEVALKPDDSLNLIFVHLTDLGITVNGSKISEEDFIPRVANYGIKEPKLILSVARGATSQSFLKMLHSLKKINNLDITVVR